MKKLLLPALVLFLFINGVTAQENITTIKGKVKYWPSDTIYLQTMPFHSPHSSELKYQTISKDSTFSFEFENVKKPFIVQLYLSKQIAESNKEHLLLKNLTPEYYYGYCIKFYTYGTTTFLIEPHKTLDIALERNWTISKLTPERAEKYRKIGVNVSKDNTLETTKKTSIDFGETNRFENEYYQKSFNLDDKFDKRLDIYKSMSLEKAIVSYNKLKQKLLNELETDKIKLSPTFYEYINAKIEFGARKEFLKFLMLTREDERADFFSKEIPKEIMDIIEFDKSKINSITLLSEEYNKFLMLYLNFKNKSYNKYYEYDRDKITLAIKNFPKASVYYFLANYLLLPETNRKTMMENIKNEEAIEELIIKTITKYPDGELNDKLIEKYDL